MSIDLEVIRDTNLCLTFFEANILIENMKTTVPETKEIRTRQKRDLFARLKKIVDNTEDLVLKDAASSLLLKLAQLNQADYDRLCQDFQTGDLLFPANYRLPCQYPENPDKI